MKLRAPSPMPSPTELEYARDYLFDMIDELAKMARRTGEIEVAIHLRAILDAARVTQRKGAAE